MPVAWVQKFEKIFQQFKKLQKEDSDFEPARPVVANPMIQKPDQTLESAITIIENSHSRKAAEIFNAAYRMMILLLLRFYTPVDETQEEREGIKKIVFFPIMILNE